MNDLEIRVKLAIEDIQKGVKSSRELIKSLGSEKASIVIDLKKEALQAGFAKIKEDLKSLSDPANIRPITFGVDKQNLEQNIAQVRGAIAQLSSKENAAQIKIEADKKSIEASIAEVRQKLQDISAQKITPELKIEKAQAQETLKQLNEDLKNLKGQKVSPEVRIERQKAEAELKALEANLKRLNSTKTSAQIEIEKAKAISDLAQIKGQLKSLDKLKIDIEVPKNTALELRAIGESFSAISGVLTQLKNDAVASFKEFDAAKTKLTTIGDSGKALAGELRGLSKELGFQASATELANGGYTALSGGFTKSGESAKILKAATVGAVGGFSDADKVTKALVATLNAYGAGSDQASTFVDKFSSVQQNGIITIDEYSGQIAQIAPIAAQAGVGLDELNGFIATATSSGVPASQTFSGLRQAIASTLKPSSEATKLAEQLGISFDAQALKTKGLAGILGDLRKSGSDTAENLVQLFGSVEAVSAIAPSAGAGFAKLQSNIAGSADSAGLAAKNFDTVANSVGGRAKALQIELDQSLAQFGEKILAVTNPVVQGTTAIVRAFNALPEPVQAAIAIFVGGGAAVAAFGAAVATISAVATPTIAGLQLISSGIIGLITAQTGLGVATAASTGLTIAESAAFGAAGASAGAATTGITGLTVATGLLGLALSPLVVTFGLLVGAIATANFIKSTNELKNLNEELDISAKTAQNTGNETFRLAEKLRTLNEARKNGTADPSKEKGFLDIAKQQLATLEKLKKEQQEIASKASNPEQKQAAQNLIKDYEIQTNSLSGQVSALEEIKSATVSGTTATKDQTKALKEQLAEQEKIAKKKVEIDASAETKRQDFSRGESRKTQEQTVTKERDSAVDDLKIKQEQEIARFKLAQENKYGDIKLKGEKDIASFKEQSESALEVKKQNFSKLQEDQKFEAQTKRQAAADNFRKSQEAADQEYQKRKEEAQRRLADELSGARNLVDREGAINQADPKEAEKLRQKFADEDRIRQQVASTNVDTKSSKQQFANQAKQIAGVNQIKSAEDAAKVQLALTELEAKAKAIAAEEERKKDLEFVTKKQEAEKLFNEGQRVSDKAFDDAQKQEAINFENNVLKPQKTAIEDQITARKLAFEQTTLQPLKLKQEEDLALLRQQKSNEQDALKTAFENQLNELRKAAKLEDIKLDAEAQKLKLDTEAGFKQNQRDLDLQNAKAIAQILTAAQINKSGLSAALGTSQIPKFSSGVEDFGGGLAYVHAGEVLMNLSKGTSVIPASKVSGALKGSGGNLEGLLSQIVAKLDRPNVSVSSSKDPNEIISEVYRQSAINSMRRNGI